MKKAFSIFLIVIINTVLYSAENKNLGITAEEIYIRLYPMSQYLEVNEYSFLIPENEASKRNIEIKDLVSKRKYCENKFDFITFKSAEEEMTYKRGVVEGHYKLLTYQKDIKKMFEEAFSKILNTEVKLEITDKTLELYYEDENIEIRENNAIGVYKNHNKYKIIWDNRNDYYEIVFGNKNTGKYNRLTGFGNDVKSPEISEKEIKKIRNSSKPLPIAERLFQEDSDIFRLKHLIYYGKLIEEYKEKTGHYPCEDKSNLPVYVFVLNDKQEEYFEDTNPENHKVISMKDLISEIEDKLGRDIEEYYDPQFVPVERPNFYIYMVRKNEYFFAVHLSDYYDFTTKIDENYYKTEISNSKMVETTLTIDELLKNSDFIEKVNSTPKNSNFFEMREKAYIKFTKK